MTKEQALIAGEPVANLLEGLARFNVTRNDRGTVNVRLRLEGEVGASWLRAIERYGADLITADRLLDNEQRHADALVRIVTELDDFMDRLDVGEGSSR